MQKKGINKQRRIKYLQSYFYLNKTSCMARNILRVITYDWKIIQNYTTFQKTIHYDIVICILSSGKLIQGTLKNPWNSLA